MTGFAFDSNIVIDALNNFPLAHEEIRRAFTNSPRAWISRMVWIEVLSKGSDQTVANAHLFLSGFSIDEVDADVAERAAALRRERVRLKAADAVILASAQVKGRVLVTRNIRDFPPTLPGVRVPYTF